MRKPRPTAASWQVWRNNEEGVLAVEPTEGLQAVLASKAGLEQGLGEGRYHRIIHVRNAAVNALREVGRLLSRRLTQHC